MNDYAALLSRKNADAQSRQNLFEDLHSRLIGRKSSSAELFDDGSPTFEFGPYWKTFQKKFVPELEKMCGRNGTNLSKMSGKVNDASKAQKSMATWQCLLTFFGICFLLSMFSVNTQVDVFTSQINI